MDLSDYLRILRRNWISIVAFSIAGLVIGSLSAVLAQPTYVATTQLFVATHNSGSVGELQQGNTFTQARVQSYVKTVTTPAVLQPALDSLGLEMTPAELASKVTATSDSATVLLSIQATDDSPVAAAAIAQAVSESLIRVVEQLERPEAGTSPVKLSVVTPATAPSFPSSPNTKVYVAVGLLTGVLAGLCVALIRAMTDTRVRGELDLRKISTAPVLGGIAFDVEAVRSPLLTQVTQQSPRAEAFREIRTNLQFCQVNGESNSFLVTSSLPAEGKSTTSTNLAIALASSGRSVVLVDADLRRPSVDSYLGLERSAGLTTALLGKSSLDDLLQPWGQDELFVLTSGPIPPNPSELLGSAVMQQLVKDLESRFDTVIIDAPPLLPVTDAAVLAQHVGGVVLVVGSSKTRLPALEQALKALSMVDANVLGVVFNLLPTKGPDAYSYSYYSYDSHPSEPSVTKGRSQQRMTKRSRAKGTRINKGTSRTSGSHYVR